MIISPQVISNKMLRRSKYNLNTISNDAALELLDIRDRIRLMNICIGYAINYNFKKAYRDPNLKEGLVIKLT